MDPISVKEDVEQLRFDLGAINQKSSSSLMHTYHLEGDSDRQNKFTKHYLGFGHNESKLIDFNTETA